MEQVDEIIQEFLVESYDSLDQLDAEFLALEEDPSDRERLSSIFRTVHTIKGTSGFLDMPKIEKVAHVGENLLVPLRDGELTLTTGIADALLGMVDAIREMLRSVESSGTDGENEYGGLIIRLEQARSASAAAQSVADAAASGAAPAATAETTPEQSVSTQAEQPAVEAQPDASPGPQRIDRTTTADTGNATPETSAASNSTHHDKPVVANARESSVADSTVRIHVELLDELMNLVGELVLTRNQILQYSQESPDVAISSASQRLNLITTELQEGVMKTRMQPIRNAWNKLPRVVRDLSSSCGKQVQVQMEGADTELDKTILEAIKDPLTHIVRNSVDHGIESPAVRIAAGKPAVGTLSLRAFHEGGQVNIEIADDGAGINLKRVREKAIEKGLTTADQADTLSDRDLTNLILLPGFSTAQEVTNVSGRGVGMDVVRTNIEKIGGSLELHSQPGQGTTLRIKIPLTLAIVPALVVASGTERYAIPQVSLMELVRLEGERARSEIEMIHDVPVYRLRGNLLPLLYLDKQLELKGDGGTEDSNDGSVNIVVLQAEDRQFGLVVDAIHDTQEIVVKPLGRHLKSVSTFAGATIMGDGTIALILDVFGLAQAGNILGEHQDRAHTERAQATDSNADQSTSVLIVDQGDGTRAAIELASVARLEEFDRANIEQTEDGPVVQYRGGILPLVPMSSDTGQVRSSTSSSEPDSTPVQVVVFDDESRQVGVVVGRIVDVVEYTFHESEEELSTAVGLQVIQDRVTKIVDLASTVRSAFPEIVETRTLTETSA